MPKRFHDTEIWVEDWFIFIPKDYRDFWLYIKDKCDHAGIWRPNIATFNKIYDCQVEGKKAIELFNNSKARIRVLENGRWFIEDFICFQYGDHLNPNNRVHLSIIKVLQTNGVKLTSIRGLLDHKEGVKDKDKDKDNKGIYKGGNLQVIPNLEEVKAYCKERKNNVDPDKWFNFYSAKGWMIGKNKIKDWKAAVRTWEQKEPEQYKSSGKTPVKLRILTMRASKINDTEIKQSLLTDYTEAEIDAALGRS